MNCSEALNHIDDFLDHSLPGPKMAELDAHLQGCATCREEFRQEQQLIATLRDLPAPPPSQGFVERSLATARASHQKERRRRAMFSWAGALATACLAFWLVMAGPAWQESPSETPGSSAIRIQLHEQRLVQLMVQAPHDMNQADVVIELPPQLEVAGFPGRRQLRWNTNLHKGKNLLRLPLVAKGSGTATLKTRIEHANKSKMMSLVMQVAGDEMTRYDKNRPPIV